MAKTINLIEIWGLHGYQNFRIPIRDNRLVLIGVNGIGKTTVVNILYYFLSRQWRKLAEFEFEKISIRIGTKKLTITADSVIPPTSSLRYIFRTLPPVLRKRINIDDQRSIARLMVLDQWKEIEDRHGIPSSALKRRFEAGSREAWQNLPFIDDGDDGSNIIRSISEYIDNNIFGQILYLPTYRRIEQDLQSIFPNFDDEYTDRVAGRLARNQSRKHGYIELVQFGMEDVESKIRNKINSLKDQARIELNDLVGSYLRDVIGGVPEQSSTAVLNELGEMEIDRILARVEERTLPKSEKNKLKETISDVRNQISNNTSEDARYAVHFFLKLVDMHRSQTEKEQSMYNFSNICNNYLDGKTVEFDETEYDLKIVSDNGEYIKPHELSSGEKQIVSLMSHIYLSDYDSFNIIIDEPELSLSMEWQKRLLPDLVNSEKCNFLIAVTHSPFIFDNELDDYAVDLRKCRVN